MLYYIRALTLTSFAPNTVNSLLLMKLMHNYAPGAPDMPANKAARFAGADMLSYGGLVAYLTVFQNMAATTAMGWSLVPIVGHLVLREVIQETTETDAYKTLAGSMNAVLGTCAYSLITGSCLSKDVAAVVPMAMLGVTSILCILFPDDWM